MRNLVPLTKILLTLGTAVWAIIFREPFSLALLCVLELIILLVSNELFKNVKALMMLCVFAFFLGLIEYIGGGTEKECAGAALRMLGMTIKFIYLLATVRLQDLTAAIEQTSWGPVRRVNVPLHVGDVPETWDYPASALGSSEATWR